MDEWRLNWRDRSWSSTDLTGEHVAAVAEMLGVAPSWDMIDVTQLHPALGPLQVMSLIAAFVVVEDDVRGEAARRAVLAAVKEASVDELLAAIELPVEV